ncbi:MAG: type II secretion system F family protein [Planctomycetota bacterium]
MAQALSTYPKIFPATYVSMVRVGEEAGLLSDMLRRLAKLLDEEHQLRSKLKAAMVYPIFLSCVGLGTVIVLMVWVIPKFSSFFTSLEHQLPLPTRFVLEVSSILARAWPFVLIIGVLIVLFGLRLLKIKTVRFMFDRLCLRIPVVGGLIIKTQLAQLMRTLGILLSHGINMLGALSITADTLSNKFIADQVDKACEGVTRGEKLHECFSEKRVFPVTMLGVMAIGQESGDLPQMLLRVSEQYEQQTERRIQALTSMIEPVMILVMGGIVGFVVVSMLMPIFKVSTLVH